MPFNLNLLKGTITIFFNISAGQLVALLYSILGTRIFKPNEFGPLVSSVALSMLIPVLIDFGFMQETLRTQILESKHHFAARRQIFLRILFLGYLIQAVYCIFDFQFSRVLVPLIGLSWYFSILAAVPYRSSSNLSSLSMHSVLGRFLGLAIACLILSYSPNLFTYYAGFIFIYLSEAMSLYFVGRKRYPAKWNNEFNKAPESSAVAILPVIQNFDVLAISGASPGSSGLYSAVNKWPAALGSIATALNVALFKNHISPRDIKKDWRLDVLPYFAIILIASVFTLLFSRDIIHWILPKAYWDSLAVFRILMIISLVSFWNQIYYSRFIALGYHKQLILIYTSWTLVQIIGLFAITKLWNLLTALISVLLIQFMMLANFLHSENSFE